MIGRFFVFCNGPTDEGLGYTQVLRDFWVVELHGIDPEPLAGAFELLFRESSGQTFVLFQPWWPGTERYRELFSNELPNCRNLNGEMWADSESSTVNLTRLVQLRKMMGSSRSGLWLVGIAPDVQEVQRALIRNGSPVGSPAGLAIEAADVLDVALAFDEGGVTTVMLRRNRHSPEFFKAFLTGLRELGVREATDRSSWVIRSDGSKK